MSQFVFEQVRVEREGRLVLDVPRLVIAEQRVGIVGLNGSGKSTLLRLMNGLVAPTSGDVCVDGLNTKVDGRRIRKTVGFIFQNPDNQIVYPIVSEDLGFGLKNIGIPKSEIPGRIAAALTRLQISHLSERQSHLLSGGEKQLVALAAVMVMEPHTILFDEPTAGLDLRNRNHVCRTLGALAEQAVIVSHDLMLLDQADRVLVMADGCIIMDAPAKEAIQFYTAHCG
ncbi:biotin transport system ATP-binding protein [Rhodoligotrophos appendicifer]|uniref:energy-coupling factor ABC transporter ATP-binding protein n=1 Tax=Rhodoligotrophos appendicifer TaxID=987056 RepID=UPI001184A7B2|nr:ABC transporter ATP-binding protein [Rhodoligotrophos appendicifer]